MLVLVLAACGRAEAVPAPAPSLAPAKVPAGWRALPDMAHAIAAAAHTAADAARAWGEPARGCYAAWLAVPAPAAGSDAIERELRDAPGLALDRVTPAAGGAVDAAFTRAPYHGRLRAATTAGRLEALACFWNTREPAACEAACNALLGGAR